MFKGNSLTFSSAIIPFTPLSLVIQPRKKRVNNIWILTVCIKPSQFYDIKIYKRLSIVRFRFIQMIFFTLVFMLSYIQHCLSQRFRICILILLNVKLRMTSPCNLVESVLVVSSHDDIKLMSCTSCVLLCRSGNEIGYAVLHTSNQLSDVTKCHKFRISDRNHRLCVDIAKLLLKHLVSDVVVYATHVDF